jgi:hypothetical protein
MGIWGTIPGRRKQHRFLVSQVLVRRGSLEKMTQTQLFWRNMIALGASIATSIAMSIAMFRMFVTLGEALRFTVTTPLFNF